MSFRSLAVIDENEKKIKESEKLLKSCLLNPNMDKTEVKDNITLCCCQIIKAKTKIEKEYEKLKKMCEELEELRKEKKDLEVIMTETKDVDKEMEDICKKRIEELNKMIDGKKRDKQFKRRKSRNKINDRFK